MYYLTRILIGLSLFLSQCFLYHGDDGDNFFQEKIVNITNDTVKIRRSVLGTPPSDSYTSFPKDTVILIPGEIIIYSEFISSPDDSTKTKTKLLDLIEYNQFQTEIFQDREIKRKWEPIEPFYGGDSIRHMMNIDNWFFYPNGTGDQYEGSVVFFITEEDLVE
jgi:hypothetical protein